MIQINRCLNGYTITYNNYNAGEFFTTNPAESLKLLMDEMARADNDPNSHYRLNTAAFVPNYD